ncbi:MAG: peptidase S41 [Bacteroidetes bacterium]|nr:peptidase S41 [Bacteroidota bacterium]
MKSRLVPVCVILVIFASCSSSKSSFNPNKKYSPEQLQKDYSIMQHMLEESHPGLYWYTPKDSIDYFFNWGRERLKDSLNEHQFRTIISYVLAKIDCGHTTVRPSKKYSKYIDSIRAPIFPLSIKAWPDTLVVTADLNEKDSMLSRGTVITAINHTPINTIIDTMFQYISTDGHNRTHKYQTLSNRGSFGSWYSSIYGLSPAYSIDYLDNAGRLHSAVIPVYNPKTDTSKRRFIRRLPKLSKKERKKQNLYNVRLLSVDTVNHIGFMDLGSFGRNLHLRRFYRSSFKTLNEKGITNLVIDVRGNGGGSVTNSTLLSKYITDTKFKVGDSLYTHTKRSHYGKYIQSYFFNRLFMIFFTHKKKDGNYHFAYFEHHYFKPKKTNHYTGTTYILTGGNSFSATTLFVSSVIKQQNVIVVGEETGGGAYGNTAWLIPDVTLPETKIKFRLPLFRLVIDKNIPKNGRGVQPEVFVPPTTEAIRRGADYKMEKVMELIKENAAHH